MSSLSKEDIEGLEMMERYGGDFVRNIAKAWFHADSENQMKLRNAFGNYLDQYKEMAKQHPRG